MQTRRIHLHHRLIRWHVIALAYNYARPSFFAAELLVCQADFSLIPDGGSFSVVVDLAAIRTIQPLGPSSCGTTVSNSALEQGAEGAHDVVAPPAAPSVAVGGRNTEGRAPVGLSSSASSETRRVSSSSSIALSSLFPVEPSQR